MIGFFHRWAPIWTGAGYIRQELRKRGRDTSIISRAQAERWARVAAGEHDPQEWLRRLDMLVNVADMAMAGLPREEAADSLRSILG